jgi:Tol biopolymer transport system component
MYEPGPFEIKGDIDANHVYFSPDGRQLLLVHTTMTSDVEIWLLPIPGGAGSAPRRLSLDAMPRVSGEMPRFSWMPDNRNVIMSIRSAAAPKGGLWLVDTQGGVSTLLSAGLTGQHSPSVSPDGSKIAFALGGYDLDLVEIPTDGSPVRDLLATAGDEHSGTWMPNGAGFVYVTDRNGTQELRAYSKTGQEDRIIAAAHSFGRDTVGIGAPTPSPDGQRIAYYLLDPSGGVGIWVSPFGGGAPVRLTNGPDPEASPEWSPDGQSIAYYRLTAGGAGVLMVREVGTSDPPRELKAPGLSEPIISPPAWSPNGQWIAYAAGTGVHLISPDGERTRLLTPIEHTGLVWSRDSGTLYTSRRMQDGTTQIQGINTATRTVRTINTLPDGFELNVPISPGRRFTLAPDGKSFMASNVHFSSDIWILQNFMPKRALFHGLGW